MKNLQTYEEFIINESLIDREMNEASIKTIAMLFQNKGIKDAIKKERADTIRKAIEDEGLKTKGISNEEILQIAKDLSESINEEDSEKIKQEFSNATIVRDENDLPEGTEVKVNALEYSSKGDEEMVNIIRPDGKESSIIRNNLKIQI